MDESNTTIKFITCPCVDIMSSGVVDLYRPTTFIPSITTYYVDMLWQKFYYGISIILDGYFKLTSSL